jgi:hypothetical protein
MAIAPTTAGLRFSLYSRPLAAMVLICWDLHGNRCTETVPVHQARHRRLQLEQQGAVVYWSERLANG